MSLDIDTSPLITQISLMFPVFFGILIIPAGWRIALKMGHYLIEQFADAFG